jgi:hypothetical protein
VEHRAPQKEWARTSDHVRARGDVQILWKEMTAADRYVADREWERAVLYQCPVHPRGGCGLRKLGTYLRVAPSGARVARFWCPLGRVSISLLPAFMAARLSGTLDEVEAVVRTVEQAGGVAAAVEAVHPAGAARPIGTICAMRSIRRRLRAVRAALLAIVTLLPERFAGVVPTLGAMGAALDTDRVLVAVRDLASQYLHALPTPLGFRARAEA